MISIKEFFISKHQGIESHLVAGKTKKEKTTKYKKMCKDFRQFSENQQCDWIISQTNHWSVGVWLKLPVLVILHCWCLLYLLRTEVRVCLPYFARPPLDDCIAEHSDDHDKQEVACVHQVQVDERTVILGPKEKELLYFIVFDFKQHADLNTGLYILRSTV